jgi:hypothetical protein
MAKKHTSPQPLTTAAPAYLQNPLRIGAILGSFLILVIPLAILQMAGLSESARIAFSTTYAVLLGGTHFLITLALYFQSDNLKYFASSGRNIAIYFVGPAVLLVGFFLISAFQLTADHPDPSPAFLFFTFLFFVIVKAADYFHVVRQSFGMLQIFKAQTPVSFPQWMRRADNNFFLAMAALQLLTYINGVRTGTFTFALSPLSGLTLVWAGVSLASVLAGFASAAHRGTAGRALLVPFGYFLLQGTSATLPALRTELYTASLAMHYVEYHIIIFPRLFSAPLDPARTADRLALWTRQHKFLFYTVLATLACFVSREIWPVSTTLGSARGALVMFNLLSGARVTHYFIEAFVWKFRNPYYRQSLTPIYFPRRDRQAAS